MSEGWICAGCDRHHLSKLFAVTLVVDVPRNYFRIRFLGESYHSPNLLLYRVALSDLNPGIDGRVIRLLVWSIHCQSALLAVIEKASYGYGIGAGSALGHLLPEFEKFLWEALDTLGKNGESFFIIDVAKDGNGDFKQLWVFSVPATCGVDVRLPSSWRRRSRPTAPGSVPAVHRTVMTTFQCAHATPPGAA